jgi:hypothetical protein
LNVLSPIIQLSVCIIQSITERLETWFKDAIKPRSDNLVVGTGLDLIRGKSELVAENALLRQ